MSDLATLRAEYVRADRDRDGWAVTVADAVAAGVDGDVLAIYVRRYREAVASYEAARLAYLGE